MGELLRAALLVPPGDSWRWMSAMNQYAELRGWHPSAWVHTWTDLVAAVNRCRWCGMGGGAHVGVVPAGRYLDPDRTPRLVIMSEEPVSQPQMPTQRRPRRLRP